MATKPTKTHGLVLKAELKLTKKESSKVLAIGQVIVNGVLALEKVMVKKKNDGTGLYVTSFSYKDEFLTDKKGEAVWKTYHHPIEKEFAAEFRTVVLEAYQELLKGGGKTASKPAPSADEDPEEPPF